MVIAIALQLFLIIYDFELWVEMVASKASSESGVIQTNERDDGMGYGG